MKLQRRLNGAKGFRFKVLMLVLFLVFYLLVVNVFVGRDKSFVRSIFIRISGSKKKASRDVGSQHTRREADLQPFSPGSFLRGEYPHNESYCWFRYGTVESFDWENVTVRFSPELGKNSPYRVIYNVIENMFKGNIDNMPDVTYCTHVTPSFQCNVLEIARRWNGPISIAAYVPDYDATLSLLLFQRMCQCLPEMSRVSVHFVFPETSPPVIPKSSQMSLSSLESIDALIKFPADCSCPEAVLNGSLRTFRDENGQTYPVNVGRNVAREASMTSHVLVSDVELLPSANLVPAFQQLMQSYGSSSSSSKHVFVLPVFEIEARVRNIPNTKEEIQHLYGEGQAVYFHRWVCLHCQRFPGLERWLQRKKGSPFPLNTGGGVPATLKPLLVVRREFPHHRWEPVYIGTRQEPYYSEHLSWEGRQDKMTQMHAMCILGYRFVILDGGFLVHTPGMKRPGRKHSESVAWRQPHEEVNARLYERIVRSTEHRLGSRPAACRLH